MKCSDSLDKIAPELVAALNEMGGAAKNASNPFFKSKFADLETVIEASRPTLSKHNLAIVQLPGELLNGVLALETVIMHTSGQWIAGDFGIAVGKMDPQSIGSALTYARRYAQMAALNMPAVDDDGETAMTRTSQAAKAPPKKSPEAAKPLPAIERSTILEDHMRACTDRKDLKAVWERGAKVCSELQGEHDARLDFLMKLYDELYEKLPKPKTEARPDYDVLVKDMVEHRTSTTLLAWLNEPETTAKVDKLPVDWRDTFRSECKEKLSDLKTEERAIAESESMGIRA